VIGCIKAVEQVYLGHLAEGQNLAGSFLPHLP
jgi:hypothetical protein